MPQFMTIPRDIYYISGNTTILAKDMAKTLLSQFPDKDFHEESIPFIRNAEDPVRAPGNGPTHLTSKSCEFPSDFS